MFEIFRFDHQKLKFCFFFWKSIDEIHNFQDEKRNLCYQKTYKHRHAKFQSNIIIFGCQLPKNWWRWWSHCFETQFLAFLIVVHQNKWHFWNSETKLDKIGILWKKIFISKICAFWGCFILFDLVCLIYLILIFPRAKFRNECHHRFPRPKWPIKHVSHDIHAIFWFGNLTYLIWPWPLLSIRSILIWYLLHPLGSVLEKFGLAVVISPVSVADKAKSNDFDIWPDLDLARDLLRKF